MPTETGYTLEKDGSARIAVLTNMPNVEPQMWDWWFGWHGCSSSRYKLWHPKAHVSAAWKDGKNDHSYIGRTSLIEEYIGTNLEKASISFMHPQALGFTPAMLADKTKAVYICARVGYTGLPLQFGYLVHQVRATEGGAEMRSRFWMGGSHVQIGKEGLLTNFLSGIAGKIKAISAEQAKNLLLHCAEEMSHLAGFLPSLYRQYH